MGRGCFCMSEICVVTFNMTERNTLQFLQWALPKLGLAWPGYRRVHHQVCKRIGRRLAELHLADAAQYRAYVEGHPEEWPVLDAFCRISISRFYRDKAVFDYLGAAVLPFRGAFEGFHRTGLVDVNHGIELLRQAGLEVVALPLRFSSINDPQEMFQTRRAQIFRGPVLLAQVEQKSTAVSLVEHCFVAVLHGGFERNARRG